MPANILVVEDEPAIQELLALNITQAGHNAIRALSVEIAQDLMRETIPDLIAPNGSGGFGVGLAVGFSVVKAESSEFGLDVAELIVGQDPTRPEHLWQKMYRQHFWHGHGIVRATAISGIDLALWDIVGKALDVPVYRLIGGAARDRG